MSEKLIPVRDARYTVEPVGYGFRVKLSHPTFDGGATLDLEPADARVLAERLLEAADRVELAQRTLHSPYEGERCPRCHAGFISPGHGKCTSCNHNFIGELPAHRAYDALRRVLDG